MKRKRTAAALALLVLCLAVLPGCAAAEEWSGTYPFTAVAGKDGANLRDAPSVSARIVATVRAGNIVTVTGREGDWYLVSVPGKTCYVHVNKVTFLTGEVYDAADTPLARDAEYAAEHYDEYTLAFPVEMTVPAGRGGANFREVMNLNAQPVRILHPDEEVYVFCLLVSANQEWAVVELDGSYGYVNADYLNWGDEYDPDAD